MDYETIENNMYVAHNLKRQRKKIKELEQRVLKQEKLLVHLKEHHGAIIKQFLKINNLCMADLFTKV